MAPRGKVTAGPMSLARGGLLVGAGASALCAAIGLIFGGVSGSVSALAAAMLVLVFFLTGQIVEGLTLRMADWNGLTITVECFVLRVGLFCADLWADASTPAITQAWSNVWFAARAGVPDRLAGRAGDGARGSASRSTTVAIRRLRVGPVTTRDRS